MNTDEKAEAKWKQIKSVISPPPIGLMPRKLWNLKRAGNIYEAMKRYNDAGYKIPDEWFEEFEKLEKEINDD